MAAEEAQAQEQGRERGIGRAVVVTNTMFLSVPWADALYALDPPWWKHYGRQAAAEFQGMRYSARVHHGMAKAGPFNAFENSGTGAIALAAWMGAKRIILAGYDCQRTGGQTHSHGDHPPTLGNAKSMPQWFAKFEKCANHMRTLGIEIVNASRATALRCFPRGTLETELAKGTTE